MSGAVSESVGDVPVLARQSGRSEEPRSFDPPNPSAPEDAERPGEAVRSKGGRFIAFKILIGLVVLGASGGIAAFALRGGKKHVEPVAVLPPVVRVAFVAPTAAGVARYTGVIHARYESNLGFRVPGKIIRRLVDPGDRVRAGQPLMKLDENDLVLAVNAAHFAVDAARATSVQARSDERRRATLVTQGWISQQAYELNKSVADSSAARLLTALAQEQTAKDQLSYAVLRADVDGVITRVPGEPGEVVAAGQPVVQLAHDGSREAEVYLPEGEERSAHALATADLYALANSSFPATLRELSASADPATRTYRARYILGGGGKDAPLGSTVTVSLSEPEKNVQKVPIGAVFDDGHGPAVWIVERASQTVARRPVTVVSTGEEEAKVKSTLKGGELVVALGAQLLRDGGKVRIDKGPRDTSNPGTTSERKR